MRRELLLAACLLGAACGDPMSGVPTLAEQDVSDDAPSFEAAASPDARTDPEVKEATGGLLAHIFGNAEPNEAATATTEPTRIAAVDSPDSAAAAQYTGETGTETTPQPRKKRGIFGMFVSSDPRPQTTTAKLAVVDTLAADDSKIADDSFRQASLAPDKTMPAATTADVTPQPLAKAGLFGGFAKSSSGTSASAPKSEVRPGTFLPYGKVARVCGLSKREMGKEIAKFPEKRPMHRLYDSQPGNTGPHTLYLTGFSDGCARQFTASLAMFGSVSMHEQLRYGLPAEVQPYSDTDKAYETLKRQVCRVPKRKPCGTKISAMERSTVFISIYERFGDNARWSNLLLHDGEVLAQDHKAGG